MRIYVKETEMKVRNLESNLINDILIGMNGLSNEDYQKLKDVLYHKKGFSTT